MKHNWDVTFERVHPCEEDAEPDTESGFVVEDTDFRDALEQCGGVYASYEPNSGPQRHDVRWLTNYRYNNGTHEYFTTGVEESRSLHIPDNITPASRKRICKLLGVK